MTPFWKGFTKEAKPMHRALMLDLDGTVRRTKSGKVAPNSPDDQVLLPGRKEKIDEYKAKGYKVVGISNQGGIALGHLSDDDFEETFNALDKQLGHAFDSVHYCAAHPKSDDPRRKPNPGMFHEAAKLHGIDLAKSIYVGDMQSDKDAAERAGVPFSWAHRFFGDDV